MMELLFYPAVFHKAEEGGYWVSFPDLPECLTEGDDIKEAYEMAEDALGLCITERIKDKEEIPKASEPDESLLSDGDFVVLVKFDYLDYCKKHSSKSVKKTLSIPEWLNEEAMAKNINFSQTLQEALMRELKIL